MFKKLRLLFRQIAVLFGVFSKKLLAHSAEGLELSTNLRKFLTSGTVKALADIIPGDWDTKAVELAVKALNLTIPMLTIGSHLDGVTDPVKALNILIEDIKKLPPELQNAVLQKFLSTYTKLRAQIDGDPELKAHYYDLLAQTTFSLHKHDAEPAPEATHPAIADADGDGIPDEQEKGSDT